MLGVIARDPGAESRLDAEIRTGEGAPGQTVLLRMYGPMGLHADSVVMPLLVPDTPVVTWWPRGGPAVPSGDPLGHAGAAPGDRRRVGPRAGRGPGRPGGRLPARRHRPELDPGHALALPAGRHPGPAARRDQRRLGGRGAAATRRADLLAAWLTSRLGAPFSRDESGGPGITEVRFVTSDGDITITRPDGRTATLSRPDQPERRVALHRRDTAELLAEELRRLNPDEVYGETLASFAVGAGR